MTTILAETWRFRAPARLTRAPSRGRHHARQLVSSARQNDAHRKSTVHTRACMPRIIVGSMCLPALSLACVARDAARAGAGAQVRSSDVARRRRTQHAATKLHE
jgi:hypothetical protein